MLLEVGRGVGLVDDLETEQGFDHVLERHDTGRPSVLVHHQCQVLLFCKQLFPNSVKYGVFRNHGDFPADVPDLSQGEIHQLTRKGDLTLSEGEYRDVIWRKTAVLFEGACRSAALLAGLVSAAVVSPVSAARPKCNGYTATIVGTDSVDFITGVEPDRTERGSTRSVGS